MLHHLLGWMLMRDQKTINVVGIKSDFSIGQFYERQLSATS